MAAASARLPRAKAHGKVGHLAEYSVVLLEPQSMAVGITGFADPRPRKLRNGDAYDPRLCVRHIKTRFPKS